MEKKKVVLAFSGGLDTSFCAMYLSQELGYEVYTALANTGGVGGEGFKGGGGGGPKLGGAKNKEPDIWRGDLGKKI